MRLVYFHVPDFNRQGQTIKCISREFPLHLARRLVFDSEHPDNLKVTVGVEWTELIMNIV